VVDEAQARSRRGSKSRRILGVQGVDKQSLWLSLEILPDPDLSAALFAVPLAHLPIRKLGIDFPAVGPQKDATRVINGRRISTWWAGVIPALES